MVDKNFISNGCVCYASEGPQACPLHQSHIPYMVGMNFGAQISVSAHKPPGHIMMIHRPFGLTYELAKKFGACISVSH